MIKTCFLLIKSLIMHVRRKLYFQFWWIRQIKLTLEMNWTSLNLLPQEWHQKIRDWLSAIQIQFVKFTTVLLDKTLLQLKTMIDQEEKKKMLFISLDMFLIMVNFMNWTDSRPDLYHLAHVLTKHGWAWPENRSKKELKNMLRAKSDSIYL